MFYFDPWYLILVALPGMLIAGGASLMVRAAFGRYSRVPSRRGITGAQAARMMLDRAGVTGVEIVPTHGYLSDHYNPMT
ncbi:MAG TPA: zinc metallopeptidase, partial [Planctomycetaceae bacterium]|nr:zinc metallopeptidase [Planctomycetaceae bacterium]